MFSSRRIVVSNGKDNEIKISSPYLRVFLIRIIVGISTTQSLQPLKLKINLKITLVTLSWFPKVVIVMF